MTNCLVVQHLAVESAFAVEDALIGAGVVVETRRVFAGELVPADASGLDALVVMGGPMSAASDEGFPSRSGEITLLADALRVGIPTVGVCLGAQLLAAAAGSEVFPGAGGPEIGWGPVTLTPECAEDQLFTGLDEELTVLHWHGDSFDLPVGGLRLAGNANYPNQAFRIGSLAWGLQFHLEVTQAALEGFVSTFATDAASVPGGAEGILKATPPALAGLTVIRDLVFERFADLVVTHARERELVDQG
ncbi:MAG TPA: hypothetical protein VGL48_00700 [Acidimicrobiales bacterium]